MEKAINFLKSILGLLGMGQRRGALRVPHEPTYSQARRRPHIYWENMDDQLDANEFMEEVQSRTDAFVSVQRMEKRMRVSSSVRRFTSDGLVTESHSVLFETTHGVLVSAEELVGGGQCSRCRGFSDKAHYHLCTLCGKGLCQRCVRFIDDAPYCDSHALLVLNHLDTWNR